MEAIGGVENICECGGGAVVEIGRSLPDTFQGRRINPREGLAEALAGTRFDGADVVEDVSAAIGKLVSRVATRAIERDENHFARYAIGRKRAVRGTIRARVYVCQGGDVGCKRIELGTEPGFAVAKRLVARAGIEKGIAHEP